MVNSYKNVIVALNSLYLIITLALIHEYRSRRVPCKDVEANSTDFNSLGFARIMNSEQTSIQEFNTETNILPPLPAESRAPSPPIS